ncbi:TIGR01777 family protein [Bacillus sp. BRMEA1]|uniref:TIGR01777 family oxidoreductase n=1 Tax=Neobacillus endophyticus TaxID=2738405 RepID=UPI00156597BB|nr:TIGR01777 family oxidoreductase [Neobacillus endophyticus]NRD79697.1 TIGR01777 family protein [Neobacillus endophyticus]
MKIVIAGGSGFIGRKLINLLLNENHEVVVLTRKEKSSSSQVQYIKWLEEGIFPEKEIQKADVIINLAGTSINDGRWTPKHQNEIYESRMTSTDELIRITAALPEKPFVFINASAIGIYPSSFSEVYTEKSKLVADDFLGKTVHDWERKAERVKELGIRTVYLRFGVVLGEDSGALPLMVLPYKMYMGGTLGSGRQWVSWIHVDDAARAIIFSLENSELSGPVNVTAPNPQQMKEFGQTIASVTRRPHWLPVPEVALKMILRRKSSLVLEGQHVLPEVLSHAGFKFQFPTLEPALRDLLG